MSDDNDPLSRELDAALRSAGVTEDPGKAAGKTEEDLGKANVMLQEAMQLKQLAEADRKAALEKAESMRAYQVESLEKARKKTQLLQERLDQAEATVERAVREKELAEQEAGRVKEEAMQAMHKANEEVARLQDELLLATAQSENLDETGETEMAEEALHATMDDIDIMAQLRAARMLEADAPVVLAESAAAKPAKSKSELIKGIILFTLVGSATTIYALIDHPLLAPVSMIIEKLQSMLTALIVQIAGN